MCTYNGTILSMKTYLRIVSVVFLLVSLAHLARLVMGSAFVVGTWDVPMWVSVVGFLVPGLLSVLGFKYANIAR
jgi:hypothetical protein